MAETAGAINGTLIKVYKDVTGTLKPIANLISNDISIDMTIIDVSSKSSSGAAENITGRYSWSGSAEGIVEYDTSVGTSDISLQDIIADLLAGTSWTCVIGTGVTGDQKLTGTTRLANVKMSAPDNDKATFTCDFTGTGALTQTTFS